MVAETIFSSPIFFQTILPFLLIFALVFAILEKSKILGENKHQVNAVVSIVIGLIVISFGYAVYMINSLLPFMAVGLVIILVFMIMVGALYVGGEEFKLAKGVKYAVMGIIAAAVVVAVLYFAGAWDYLYRVVTGGETGTTILTNVIFVVLIAAAIVAVLVGGGKAKDKDKDK